MVSILSVVQGTFNQSDARFGETAGVQCACMSLFSLCWSVVKSIFRWSPSDLDFVLINGDSIYKDLLHGPGGLSFVRHLSIDDLPHEIHFPQGLVGIEFLENKTGEISYNRSDATLVSLFYSVSIIGNGFLIFINGFTIAVIYGRGLNSYFLFDSHSRNQQGLPVPEGKSILIKFSRVQDIENYLRETYLHPHVQSCYFQIQFIRVDISDSDRNSLKREFSIQKRKERDQKRKGNFIGARKQLINKNKKN